MHTRRSRLIYIFKPSSPTLKKKKKKTHIYIYIQYTISLAVGKKNGAMPSFKSEKKYIAADKYIYLTYILNTDYTDRNLRS